jgi:rod shape-determining protein MreD
MRFRRVALLVIVFALLQVTIFPHLRIAGRVPDLGLILAVAVAFDYGPEEGALVGFFAGLAYDLFLATPLGLTALAYALTAYAVGVLQGGVLRSPRWFTPVIGGASGLVAGLLFVGVGLLAGVGGVHGNQAFVTVGIASGYDALLAGCRSRSSGSLRGNEHAAPSSGPRSRTAGIASVRAFTLRQAATENELSRADGETRRGNR